MENVMLWFALATYETSIGPNTGPNTGQKRTAELGPDSRRSGA